VDENNENIANARF